MTIRSYKKSDGKTYYEAYGYIGIDEKTGKQIRARRSGFSTKREAEKAFSAITIEQQKQSRPKFKQIYDIWIELYRRAVRSSTLKQTETIFRLHILPAFGDFFIDAIKLNDVQPVVTEWCDLYVKGSTWKAYLSLIFDEAIRHGYIEHNPCSLVKTHQKEIKRERKMFLERDELMALLDEAKKYDYQWYTFFRLLAFTGLRRGEALALTWSDYEEGTIYVNKGVARGTDGMLLQEPKTTHSTRVVDLDDGTVQILEKWRIEQIQRVGIQPLMFANQYRKHFAFSKPSHVLNTLFKRCNVEPISTHGFRHTHCAMLAELGVELGSIQKRLGHGDIETTMNIYHHVTKRTKEELVKKLANY